jgi:MinD-like ATPase involved in chromosome partitioning or flagellar assembly
MLIAVCCDRGAPGSTTTALALGVASAEPTVVVEADPYGGDLMLRCQTSGGGSLPERPTIATVAEASRMTTDPDWLDGLSHELTSTTRIVPGYSSAEHAAGIADWRALAEGLRGASSRVVADLGRIHSASPSMSIAALADVVVVVTRPDMGAVRHLVDRLERLTPALVAESRQPPVLMPVVVAPKRIGPAVASQIASLLATSQVSMSVADVGFLAWDEAGVLAMEHGHVAGRDAKTPLLQTAARLVEQLEALDPAPTMGPTGPESPHVALKPVSGWLRHRGPAAAPSQREGV